MFYGNSICACKETSRIEPSSNSRFRPTLPRAKLCTLRFTQIKHSLALIRMFRNSSSSVSLLSRRSWIQHIADTRLSVCCLERGAIGLDTIRAEESISPVCAIDVGAVCNWCVGGGTSCYGW
jgi:hypothetical protein